MSDTRRKSLIRLVMSFCFLVSLGHAQFTKYSDISTQDNGDGTATVWGSGYTEDVPGHGVQHNMTAQTTLHGPNGSSNYAQGTSAGNTSVLASLSADVGDFQTSTYHLASCAEGSLGTTYSTTFGIRTSSYVFVEISSGRSLGNPSGTNCPGTCGSPHTTTMVGGQCYTSPNAWKQCLDVVVNGQCVTSNTIITLRFRGPR
jgi:hypothetical protein